MSQVPSGIVLRPDPLSEEHAPRELIARQAQLRELVEVATATQGGRGVVAWLHGPPGSGKSTVARRVLADAEDREVRTAAVNCFSNQTFFAALEAILLELRTLAPVIRDVAFKFERLHSISKKGPLAIVLDEIDSMPAKERNGLLYNLARLPNAIVLCVTQDRETYLQLDQRVQSRMRPVFVEFPAYSSEDLVSILRDRAEASLRTDSWCVADLERIAAASNGDARIAIQTLRTAAYLADKKLTMHIRPQDIDAGLEQNSRVRRTYVLRSLSEHHRLLYRIVAEESRITIGEAWRRYLTLAREQELEPMARRTFNAYKQALIVNGLITERQRNGRSNSRELRVVE